MSKRKTVRGQVFTSVAEFVEWIGCGNWIYCRHKPYHWGWAYGWKFGYILKEINAGNMYRAMDATNVNIAYGVHGQ